MPAGLGNVKTHAHNLKIVLSPSMMKFYVIPTFVLYMYVYMVIFYVIHKHCAGCMPLPFSAVMCYSVSRKKKTMKGEKDRRKNRK